MYPLIGIPCHSDYRAESKRPIYCNNRAYTQAIEYAGGIPMLIPLLDDLTALETLLPRLDGVLLSGGVDIQPGLYGENPHPLLDQVDQCLDEFELAIMHWALKEDLPTLGVCRGMQLLNVALGGDLYQDLTDQYPASLQHSCRELPRTQVSHHVYIEAGSRMEAVLGTREFAVNSLHHQAVKHPGKGVCITGRASDGVAELLEVPDYTFMLGAQFHPEEIYTFEPACSRLFTAFVQACGGDKEKALAEPMTPRESHAMAGRKTL